MSCSPHHPTRPARVLAQWLLLAAIAISTAANASDPMPPVTVLFEGSACGGDSAVLEWIGDAARLETIRSTLASPGSQAPALPTIDPAKQPVLLLSMGSQPTPGYRVSPGMEPPQISGGTLMVPMRWSQPPPGLLLPQVITTPCLLFSVPAGSFERVEIIDQQGQTRLSATRP